MSVSKLILVHTLGVLMVTVPAFAQHGSISGVLTDSSGAILQGALVQVTPGDTKTSTDRGGTYKLVDLTPGTYNLQFSFVGFSPYSTTAVVQAGAVTRLDASLTVSGNSQEMLVTDGRLHGEAESINRERTAENVLQVLPAEVIHSLPNANVADAIGRLPSVTLERDEGEGKYVQIRGTEPRYSNVTVDGVNLPSPESVRQIKLDVIPSDLVESVEISKTLLANQDGDAIGGSVNLRTRTAGEQPTLSLYGMGGFTPIFNTRATDQFGGTIGQRFGREKRLGILFGGTYDWNGRGINDVEPAPTTVQCLPGDCGSSVSDVAPNAPYYGTYAGEDLRDYRYYRARFGFEGSVDYKLSNSSSIYARGLYSHFDNFGDRWVYSPTINTFGSSALQSASDGTITSNAQIRRPVQVVGSLLLGARHGWGASTFTWEASASRAATEDQGYSQANFQPTDASNLNNILYAVNIANPYRPKLIAQNAPNLYDPTQYTLQPTDAFDVNKTYSPQVNLGAAASYSRGYNLSGHLGTFEVGGKFRNAHKFQESDDRYYDFNGSSSGLMSSFMGSTTDKNYYNNSYTEGPFVDYSKVTSFFAVNPGLFALDTGLTHRRNDPNNWNLVERVSAGYAMNTIEFGKWRLYTGLRFEATNEDVIGRVLLPTPDSTTTTGTNTSSSYVDALPSAELRYTFNQNSDLRLAYGRGIARPNYGDLPPFLSVDESNHRVSEGNPNLKPTTANNYDLLYEKYLNPLGLIQAGVFYKDIRRPIYSITTDSTQDYTGTPATYHTSQSVNGTSAWIAGFEVSIEQRLSYLPWKLNGLGISANYSYTDSRANGLGSLLGRTDHPQLQRQAPHTWNVSPTYDKGRVSIRVGVAYNAANIFSYQYSDGTPLGVTGPGGDQYLYTHLQVDAQGSYRLNHGFSAVVYGLNLNDEVFGFYQGSAIWPIQREYYKPTVGFGIRWNSTQERF